MKIYCEHTALFRNSVFELKPALLSISNSHIDSVEEWNKPLNQLPSDTLILKNKMLTPAFVNAHTHLAMSFFRAIDLRSAASANMVRDVFFKIESHLTAEDVRAFTRIGAYESLLFGVGHVWDHYYYGEAIAQALQDVGLSGVVAPTLQDVEGPGKNTWEREWLATETIHRSQNYANNGIYAAWGPHATDSVSPQLWNKIKASISKDPLPLHFHLAQSRQEFGKHEKENTSPVQFVERMGIFDSKVPLMLAHAIYLSNNDFKILKKNLQSTLVSCPFSQMIFDFPADILEWQRQNLNWAVATDTVASNDSMNVQKELRFISGFPLQKLSHSQTYENFSKNIPSLKEIEKERDKIWKNSEDFRQASFLLSRIWNIPGQMHTHVKVGILEKKSLANLIVWDCENPTLWPSKSLRSLCFQDTSSAIDNMMVCGKWVSKAGSFGESLLNSSEYKSAYKEAQKRLEILLKK